MKRGSSANVLLFMLYISATWRAQFSNAVTPPNPFSRTAFEIALRKFGVYEKPRTLREWQHVLDRFHHRLVIKSNVTVVKYLQAYSNWMVDTFSAETMKREAPDSIPDPAAEDDVFQKLDKHSKTWSWFYKRCRTASFFERFKAENASDTENGLAHHQFCVALIGYIRNAIENIKGASLRDPNNNLYEYDRAEMTEALTVLGFADEDVLKAVHLLLDFDLTYEEFSALLEAKKWRLPA